jgi:hypothetical protein
VTKAEKRRRARRARADLGLFISYQEKHMEVHLLDKGVDPQKAALGRLRAARDEVTYLYELAWAEYLDAQELDRAVRE